MAQKTRAQLVTLLARIMGMDATSGSDDEAAIIDALNFAGRRVWTSRQWRARKAEVVVATVEPYGDGTIAITKGQTALVGTGTTWTAGMTGRKITTALGRSWQRFTRTADTTGTTAEAWAEDTVTASAHVVFQDEYDTAATVDRIVDAQIQRPEWGGRFVGMSETALDGMAYVHGSTGIPYAFARTVETTVGTMRVRVYPIPDAVYRMRFRVEKSFTDMTAGADLCVLGQNLERVLIKAALLELQSQADARIVTSEAQVEDLIKTAFENQDNHAPVSYRKAGLGGAGDFDETIFLRADNPMGI